MAITLKNTLLDLRLSEDDVETHVLEIIQARPTGAERRAALSYVRQLVQRDEVDLEKYRALIARARDVLEDREALHTFDIRSTKLGSIFTVATGVDYLTPLTVANSEVIAEGAPPHHRRLRQPARHRFRQRRRRDAGMRLHRKRRALH